MGSLQKEVLLAGCLSAVARAVKDLRDPGSVTVELRLHATPCRVAVLRLAVPGTLSLCQERDETSHAPAMTQRPQGSSSHLNPQGNSANSSSRSGIFFLVLGTTRPHGGEGVLQKAVRLSWLGWVGLSQTEFRPCFQLPASSL